MAKRIYLDHAATSPLRPEALGAMEAGFAAWANPSSPHREGRAARRLIEDARSACKAALGWEGELIFTGGASEAAAIAMARAKGGARLISAVEHDAVLKAVPDAEILPVLPDGALDLDIAAQALDGRDVPVVAVQALNSETGNQQDLAAIGQIVHANGGLLLVDAAQSAGRIPLPPQADMVIVSAHKLGGPIGIGALLVRDFAMLEPSSGQERGYRRGTENMPAALGFAAALEACNTGGLCPSVLAPIAEILVPAIGRLGGMRMADLVADPAPHIEAIAMPAMSGSAQLMRFDMAGFAVSQGSACSSGSLKRSHVLEAMGVDEELASRTIRVSFGWNTTASDVERFCRQWAAMAASATGAGDGAGDGGAA